MNNTVTCIQSFFLVNHWLEMNWAAAAAGEESEVLENKLQGLRVGAVGGICIVDHTNAGFVH